MTYYIYTLQNQANLKIYVGYTENPKTRWRCERNQANNIKSAEYNRPLHRAIRKYGWDNFKKQIIEEFDDQIEALEAEKFWIEFFRTNRKKYGNEYGYNLHEGGVHPRAKGTKYARTKKLNVLKISRNNINNVFQRL